MNNPEYLFTPMFVAIPMPLDKEGRGPEMNPSLVDKTIYAVWDSTCQTVAEFTAPEPANKLCTYLNYLAKALDHAV